LAHIVLLPRPMEEEEPGKGKVAAFFFISFSPKQFSEQAFVSPRCSRLCSGLILSIYPRSGTCLLCSISLLEPGLSRSATTDLICTRQTQWHQSLVIQHPYERAGGEELNQYHQEQQLQRDFKINMKAAWAVRRCLQSPSTETQ
jgi:hypothetical protein